MAPRKSMRSYKSSAGGRGVLRATGLALMEQGIAMGAVGLGCFLSLGCGRHRSAPSSAVPAGTGPLDTLTIDALSSREHLGKSRWFELFAMMAPPCLFAVLAGWTTDAGAGSLLICLAIYSDALIALLWFVEKGDAQTEPPLSHPRPWRTARCVKGAKGMIVLNSCSQWMQAKPTDDEALGIGRFERSRPNHEHRRLRL